MRLPPALGRRGLSGRLARWRPGIRTRVVVASAFLVIVMAFAIATSVADHVRATAAQASLDGASSIVRGYVDPILGDHSLDIGAAPQPEVEDQLARLAAGGGVRRINIWTRDGTILYSTDAKLQGRRLDIDAEVAAAFTGNPPAPTFGDSADSPHASGLLIDRFLALHVPIRGASDSHPIGVFEVFLDGRPIEARVERTRADVFVISLATGAALILVVWLSFGGASRLLASQNRRLSDMNLRLNDLAGDLRQREARFRSLVQNSSDVVVVITPDGRVAYESDAVQRVLGHEPDGGGRRRFDERVHPEEAGWVRSLIAGLVDSQRAEQTTELRLRHADGSWRWVEAIGQNLVHDPAVGGVVMNYRDVTERKLLEEQLQHEAFHDPLTGLANRALFSDRVTHALNRTARRSGDRLAVLFIDLDDFKLVNDSLGHVAGDELLTAVAERIRACLRRQDTAARLGGDEFAILVEDAGRDLGGEIADRILGALRQPFALAARQLFVQASIGIALAGESEDEETAELLLRNADAAMYTAKARGKGRREYYASHMHTAAMERLELRGRLEAALEEGELVLHYQPVVELVSGRVAGAEALVRWQRPDGRLAQPDEFVPLAEETGLIVALGQYVLETACGEAAGWPARSDEPLSIAVNVASRQLQEPGFASAVAATLSRSGLPAERLVLEVTESALLDEGEATSTAIAELKRLGVRIALDDFGTGYSSLSHLRRFPIDMLKIDRSFVDGIDGQDSGEKALVRSIVRLARSLELETVAEGVERSEQLVRLRALGALYGQGFLFARPMEAVALRRLLSGEARLAG